LLGQCVALAGDGFTGFGEIVDLPPSRLDLRFQLRDEGAHNGCGAHRFRHVVWFDENGGGGIASPPLKGCKHVSDNSAPTLERTREFIGACVEARQSIDRGGSAPLGVLHLGGRLDERRGKARPIGSNGADFGLDRPPLLLRLAPRVLNPAGPPLPPPRVADRGAPGGWAGQVRQARCKRRTRRPRWPPPRDLSLFAFRAQ